MTLKDLINVDAYGRDKITGKDIPYEEKYEKIINILGYENVKRCIPFTQDEIKKALPEDQHLNNLSMKKWDAASGVYVNNATGKAVITGSMLTMLYRAHGVNCFSQSDGVCILKVCARMWAEEVI